MDISSEKKKSHFEGKILLVRSELKFSFFQVSSHFSMIFCKISKLPDISMTGKAFIIFPGAAGTLLFLQMNYEVFKRCSQIHFHNAANKTTKVVCIT